MLQKRDEFHLSFRLSHRGVDFTRARAKTGREIQGVLADIRVFDPDRVARLCRQGWNYARPGLQTGFFVHAQHYPTHRPRMLLISSSRSIACFTSFSS
jgi:hypothetical protein